jgi:hypothetical protein
MFPREGAKKEDSVFLLFYLCVFAPSRETRILMEIFVLGESWCRFEKDQKIGGFNPARLMLRLSKVKHESELQP